MRENLSYLMSTARKKETRQRDIPGTEVQLPVLARHLIPSDREEICFRAMEKMMQSR
jgi:hypothetical protein